jgi:hypothetical protein
MRRTRDSGYVSIWSIERVFKVMRQSRHSRFKVTSLLLVAAMFTSSCSEVARELDSGRRDRGVVISEDPETPTRLGLEEAVPPLRGTTTPSSLEGATRVEMVTGRDARVKAQVSQVSTAAASTNSQEPVSVNFPNTDIREVARVVLGDLYNLPYSIDPAVQGQITFETSAR